MKFSFLVLKVHPKTLLEHIVHNLLSKPFIILTKHILSERSESQGSIFSILDSNLFVNSMEFNGTRWLFLLLRLNKISWELQFFWYPLYIWNTTWL